MLNFATNKGKESLQDEYGRISKTSTGAILRRVVALEQQGADLFFGEESFEVNDFVRTTTDGQGYINIIRLVDVQNRPKLFSTFMLCLLAELFETFSEEGDLDKLKLVLFTEEAHLIFSEASKELLHQIEYTIKLIRSKGIGIFCHPKPNRCSRTSFRTIGFKNSTCITRFYSKRPKNYKINSAKLS